MRVDKTLVGTAPSRPQFHRWLSGSLTKLPHPHHCQVLEAMFPGWTARQLFESYSPDVDDDRPLSAGGSPPSHADQASTGPDLLDAVAAGLTAPDSRQAEWGPGRAWRVPAQRDIEA